VTLTGSFLSARKNMGSSRNGRALCFSIKLLAILLTLWQTAGLFVAATQHKESQNPAEVRSAPIEINTASTEDFAKLPGIGPELARRIVAYRTKHGPFHRVEDLLVIRGIGPKKWKALRPYLRVSDAMGPSHANKRIGAPIPTLVPKWARVSLCYKVTPKKFLCS
jgi:competence ComEA-like helix-hairpin-helix protein